MTLGGLGHSPIEYNDTDLGRFPPCGPQPLVTSASWEKAKKKGCMDMRCALNARGVLEGVKLRNAHNRMVKWFSRFEGKEERESITRTA